MIYPKFINNKSTIGIPAPSAGAKNELKVNKYNNAKKNLEEIVFNLNISPNINNNIKGRSANKEVRAKEINEMFKDKNIELILTASGGEFCLEILPYINFNIIKNNPKYIAGFSDSTSLLYPITTLCDISTIYGQNFSTFGMEKLHKSQKDFINIICGKKLSEDSYEKYEDEYVETVTGLEYYNLNKQVEWKTLNNKDVKIKGRMIGGCLDIISEIAGTKYDGIKNFNDRYKDDGIIWYFDNCELSLEETIRTLWKLNELEYFKYTKGIIFGRFGNPITYCEYTTKTCLEDSIISKLNIPIIYEADISHKSPCLTIINGSISTINVEKGKANITFELK